MPNKKRKREAKPAPPARTQRRSAAELDEALLYAATHNVLSSNDANVMSAQAAIAAGADVNYSHNGRSCLIQASVRGHVEIVALLLNAGADKDAKGVNGFTALLMAAKNGHAKCIELLLNDGADKEAKTD
jgi:ankyrin repeat protein